jgi:hypothetical protein
MINMANRTYLDSLMYKREAYWEQIKKFRAYTDGEQKVILNSAQIELLSGKDGATPEFKLNISQSVLGAETDRLKLQGIKIKGERGEEEDKRLTALVKKWWRRSKMDEGQIGVNYTACRDGDSFVLVIWDDEREYPRLQPNTLFVGEDEGADVFYKSGDTTALFGVKIWEVDRPVVNNVNVDRIQRKNVYYPDRIEFYITSSVALSNSYKYANWRPLEVGDPDYDPRMETSTEVDVLGNEYEATVIRTTLGEGEDSEAIGIPLIHFRRSGLGDDHGKSALHDVVPELQDAINLAEMSILAATLLSGFKVAWATKFDPKKSSFKIYPGAIIYSGDDGNFGQFQETNIQQLIAVKDSFVKDAAMITLTPLSFFNLTGDVPAAGTLRQMESGLLTKIDRDQVSLGNGYEEAARMQLKYELAYGTELDGYSLEEIDDLEISAVWKNANVRDERLDADIAKAHSELDVPEEEVWRKLGYSEEQIEDFREYLEKKKKEQQELFERQQSISQNNSDANSDGRSDKRSENEKVFGTNAATGNRSLSRG